MDKKLKTVRIDITEPIIDGDLKIKGEYNSVVDMIKENTDRSYDDEQKTHLHIVVKNMDMVATAVYFSFTNKLNITVSVDVYDFPGAHYLFSYLSRSVIGKVRWRGK